MKKKICFVVAIPGTAQSFLKDHIEALSKEYDVFLVCNSLNKQDLEGLQVTDVHVVDIHREISIWNDLKAVFTLSAYFRKMHFDAVHSVTPKAGLVTALAAWMARVPHRIHIFTGQVWATARGFKRWMLKSLDKVIATLDNHILVDGNSQREFIIKEGVVKREKSQVFGSGSISGVNTERFKNNPEVRNRIRTELGLNEKLVFILLGRMNHDKGVGDLMEAFNRLALEHPNAFLLLVGMNENGYMESLPPYPQLKEKDNYLYYGSTPRPEDILQAADVFVLPTYREGFGTSVLEASSIGLPVICSDAYGVMDAMVENETGLRCKVGDVESIYQCMKTFCEHPELITKYGDAGCRRVHEKFQGTTLTHYWVDFYRSLLK